jgi:hypothetical protein
VDSSVGNGSPVAGVDRRSPGGRVDLVCAQFEVETVRRRGSSHGGSKVLLRRRTT